MAKKNEPTEWRYVGNGAFIPGVPARDLTTAEMQEHADAIKSQFDLGVILYEAVYTEQPTVVAEEQN